MGTAVVGGVLSIVVTVIGFLFAKWKEREADQRKFKSEKYQEFVAALNGVVGKDSTPEGQRRFNAAINSLILVAPWPVLRALYKFRDEIGASNPSKTRERHDLLLSSLMWEIREDLGIPNPRRRKEFCLSLYESGTNG